VLPCLPRRHLQVRKQQISDKAAAAAALAAAKARDRADAVAAAAAEAAEADARRAAVAKAGLTQRLELQTQMVAKAHIAAAEEDEKLRTLEAAAMAEAAFVGKVGDRCGLRMVGGQGMPESSSHLQGRYLDGA
jgi:hypothetical protein